MQDDAGQDFVQNLQKGKGRGRQGHAVARKDIDFPLDGRLINQAVWQGLRKGVRRRQRRKHAGADARADQADLGIQIGDDHPAVHMLPKLRLSGAQRRHDAGVVISLQQRQFSQSLCRQWTFRQQIVRRKHDTQSSRKQQALVQRPADRVDARSDPQVHFPRCDATQHPAAGVIHQPHMYARKILPQPFEHLRQNAGGESHAASDLHAAAAACRLLAEVGQRQLEIIEQAMRIGQESIAMRGQHHFACRPLKQG